MDHFEEFGMVTDLVDRSDDEPIRDIVPLTPGMTAMLRHDRLSVDLDTPFDLPVYSWHCGADPAAPAVRRLQSIDRLLIGVTTVLLPGSGVSGDELFTAMSNRQVALGTAELLHAPPVQVLREDDMVKEIRTGLLDLLGTGVRARTGTESAERVTAAAKAACTGDGRPLAALGAEDREEVLLMIAVVHAIPSLTAGKDDPGEGTHVMTADPAGLHARWTPHLAPWKLATGLLAAAPDAPGAPDPDYRANVVFGTVEQFTAAAAKSPTRRGRLAIVVDGDADAPVLRRYRRLLVTQGLF